MSFGGTLSALFFFANPGLLGAPPARALQSLTPLDDAYCEGGAGADTSFGASTRLVSKSSTATYLDHTRKCWLKFDVSSRPWAVPTASLSLTSRDTRSENGAGPHVMRLYGLRDGLDGWSEDTITWNNAPGNESSTRYLDSSTTVLLDLRWVPQLVGDEAVVLGGPALGSFIQEDRDGLVTLVVLMEPLSSSTEYYGFHSKEGAAPPSLDLHAQAPARPQSRFVEMTDKLRYERDADGNRIPDFSMVGYRRGDEPIPHVPTVITLQPGSGDRTAAIQAAIDQVGAMSEDADGFRGAVLLRAGSYAVSGTLSMRIGGVVLRGEGSGEDGTVLQATGTTQRTLIVVGGDDSWREVSGSRTDVTDAYVPVGATRFRIADASALSVGDAVLVHRPSTAEWIHDIGMDKLDNPWQPGSKDLLFDRFITKIKGDRITVDAPICTALETIYGGAAVYRYTANDRAARIGIEDLRSESAYQAPDDENHAWTFVETRGVTDGWIRRCVAQHYGYALISTAKMTRGFTVEDCAFLDPVSQITGSRRYPYALKGQLTLVQRCFAEEGRHDFVLHSVAPGPNVFFDCVADNSFSSSGPHHRWSCGCLFDNVVCTYAGNTSGGGMEARNRGNSGTGHGWAGANMVAWNMNCKDFVIERPPTATNWAIGCVSPTGQYQGDGDWDLSGTPVEPASLYLAQLAERRAGAHLPDCLWTNSPVGVEDTVEFRAMTSQWNARAVIVVDVGRGVTPIGGGLSGLAFSDLTSFITDAGSAGPLGQWTHRVPVSELPALSGLPLFAEAYFLSPGAPNGSFAKTNVTTVVVR